MSTYPQSLFLLLLLAAPLPAVELKHVLSREHPSFTIERAQLTLGRDGKVYLFSNEYVLRLHRDGTHKGGAKVTYALMGAAANKDGVIATANAHFNHSVNLHAPDFTHLGKVSDFLVNDKVEWQAPCDVQAGGKDFYALDQNRNRIVRIAVPDQLVTTYSLEGLGEDLTRKLAHFRVWEEGQRFYVWCPSGQIKVISFDGKLLWSLNVGPMGNPWDGWQGGFDVDGAGRLHFIENNSDVVQVFNLHGQPEAKIPLDLGSRKGRISAMSLWDGDVVIRRPHPVELFQVYDRKTGKLKNVVRADVEQLSVSYASDIWTAGEKVAIQLDFDPGARKADPIWRVWLRPLGSVHFEEGKVLKGKSPPLPGIKADTPLLMLDVPRDAGGLYHLRICPDISGAASEYMVEAVVEIRQPDAKGCLSLFTPLNRYYYGRGETIPVHLALRGKDKDLPTKVFLHLKNNAGKSFAQSEVELKDGTGQVFLEPRTTRALEPGRYVLDADLPGFTIARQHLEIGPGIEEAPKFSIVQHGDYSTSYPTGTMFDLPEKIQAHLERSKYFGVNMFVDRLGHGGSGVLGVLSQKLRLGPVERLKKDPLSPVPDKAIFENHVKRAIAGYGAYGMEQRAILLYMDAGLPVGTGFDARKPEEYAKAIAAVNGELADYPAFRGWSWAANWWIGQHGAAAAPTPEKQKQYQAALKRAKETGAWDPILDEISGIVFGHAVSAEKMFRSFSPVSKKRKLISAMTAPYRAVGAHPPILFQNADEIDLHYQAEQIQPPMVAAHHVDFYKRPGKRAWGHPELWNDEGTGGQILSTTLQMFMRGADGIGFSGDPMSWRKPTGDPRSLAAHIPSIHHELNQLLLKLGPWHTTLKNRDPFAIVVSTRMMRIDDWSKIGGLYFDRLYEAYNACLYAHRPASFVFVEDLKPDTFKDFKAVLVVGQRVELDPPLAKALADAKKAGLFIFHDATCRPELVKDFEPLGFGFDRVEKDPSAWQDDAAYYRFPRYFKEHAAHLKKVLGERVPPVAKVDQPEVLVSERVDKDGNRFIWVLNNTMLDLEPGLAWRLGLILSHRLPVVAKVEIEAKGGVIYDVFHQKMMDSSTITADLRSFPAKLYAILPKKIEKIILEGPKEALEGQSFLWKVTLQDKDNLPIKGNLPLSIHFKTASLHRYDVQSFTDGGAGKGVFTVPIFHGFFTRPILGGFGTWITAQDLISGLEVSQEIRLVGGFPPALSNKPVSAEDAPLPADAKVWDSHSIIRKPIPKEMDNKFKLAAFSGHDVPRIGEWVQGDGFSAFTFPRWNRNLTLKKNGPKASLSNQKIGHHFAFDLKANKGGLAAVGFDIHSPHGYHLYLLDPAGKVIQRFPHFGLPDRKTTWANGSDFAGRGPSFAVASDGSWVASAGELGLAVWSRDGKLLWSRDWWQKERKEPNIFSPQDATLVLLEGTNVTAFDVKTGRQSWKVVFDEPGRLLGCAGRGELLAVRSTFGGGTVYLLEKGKVIATFPTAADQVFLSEDGKHLITTAGNLLKCFEVERGLRWTLRLSDSIRTVVFPPKHFWLHVLSKTDSLAILDREGNKADIFPIPDGDLYWMAARFLPPSDPFQPIHFDPDPMPPAPLPPFGNAAKSPAPLTPNLLKETRALLFPTMSGKKKDWQHKADLLVDGKPDAPADPWLPWTTINYIDSGWYGPLEINIDTFRAQLKLTGVTFVEDPKHPESWLRDVKLQYWDAAKEQWRDGPMFLSNEEVHTHWLEKPIEAARYRLVSTGPRTWPVGNLRLGELVFHGEILGASHPDAAAKKPVAVLFDEKEDDLKSLFYPGRPFAFQYEGAYSGGKCLVLKSAGGTGPAFVAPFGHAVPNWDFEIVEKPGPGQYRYLQFAWKALSKETKGMSLLLGRAWPGGGYNLFAGDHDWKEGVLASRKIADAPPTEWQVVTVDLWELYGKEVRVQALSLSAFGGGAAFDRIELARTREDLK